MQPVTSSHETCQPESIHGGEVQDQLNQSRGFRGNNIDEAQNNYTAPNSNRKPILYLILDSV